MSEKNNTRHNHSTKISQTPSPLGEGWGGVLFPCRQGGEHGVGIKKLLTIVSHFTLFPDEA